MKLILNIENKVIDFSENIIDNGEGFYIENKDILYPYESMDNGIIVDIGDIDIPDDLSEKEYKYIDGEFILK